MNEAKVRPDVVVVQCSACGCAWAMQPHIPFLVAQCILFLDYGWSYDEAKGLTCPRHQIQ